MAAVGRRYIVPISAVSVSAAQDLWNFTATASMAIRLVRFDQPQLLQKEGDNTYSAPAGVAPTPDPSSRLVQGSIEKANVSAVVQMTRLIDISRAYQQVANLLQNESDLHKTAIQQLASVPS